MQKHAYLILAHANPGQLRKLLALLDDPRNDIFVHIDKKAPFGPKDLEGCCKASGLSFVEKPFAVHWGGVSIMRAELALLKTATKSGSYAYYHLLSGMDLPIKSQDEIHSFFQKNAGKEFLHYWKFKPTTASRFNYFTVFPEGGGFFLTNLLNNMFKGIFTLLHIKINKDVEFKYASQWFSITDACARYVVKQERRLEKIFSHTSTCDEVFLATIVWDSPFRYSLYDEAEHYNNHDIGATANMRFIDWSRGKSIRHPWVFTKDDLELLRSVPHFWARKFDERVDSEIIENVYTMLLNR